MRSVLHRKILARVVVGVSAAALLLPMMQQQFSAPPQLVVVVVASSLAALLGMSNLRGSRRRVTARARA
jgi:hypothetical protein